MFFHDIHIHNAHIRPGIEIMHTANGQDIVLGTEDDIDVHPNDFKDNMTLQDLNVRLKQPHRLTGSAPVRSTSYSGAGSISFPPAPYSGLEATTDSNIASTEIHQGVTLTPAGVIYNIGCGVTMDIVISRPESEGASNMVFDTGGNLFRPDRLQDGHVDQANNAYKISPPQAFRASHQIQESPDSEKSTNPGTACSGALTIDKNHRSGKDPHHEIGSCIKCECSKDGVQCFCRMVNAQMHCHCGVTVSRQTT